MNHAEQEASKRIAARRSWPFLAAPIGVYLLIMVPICLMEFFLIASRCPDWMRWSGATVLMFTIWVFVRGYVRRLVLTPRSAQLRRLGSTIEIPWDRVQRVGVYTPGGGLGTTRYVFITARSSPPDGKWDIDAETIQLQDRPDLLDAVERARAG